MTTKKIQPDKNHILQWSHEFWLILQQVLRRFVKKTHNGFVLAFRSFPPHENVVTAQVNHKPTAPLPPDGRTVPSIEMP